MFFWKRSCKQSPSRSGRPGRHRASIGLEQLETRMCPTVTDMTALAQLAPEPDGPTMLWLNFDGWTNYNAAGDDVTPFTPASGDREQAIHDIMFKTAEIFAPFNVQVARLWGSGFHDRSSSGNTTVFVGNNTYFGGGRGAYTPWAYMDHPGTVRGVTLLPNSNPYDVAFADPVTSTGLAWSNATLAQFIAHEAGHTFGLGHVRTVGADPATLAAFDAPGTTWEMMSYDSTNRSFRNLTFNMTAANQTPAGVVMDPRVVPTYQCPGAPAAVPLQTQNSYTYLTEILGPRPLMIDGRFDWHANVADRGAVDPGYRAGSEEGFLLSVTPPSGSSSFSRTGAIERAGDYDVFTLSGGTSGAWYEIEVNAAAVRGPNPVVIVFDGTGRTLLAFNDDFSSATRNSKAFLRAAAFGSYFVVVGAAHNWSAGDYTLVVRHTSPFFAPLAGASFASLPAGSGAAGEFGASSLRGPAARLWAPQNPVPDALPRQVIVTNAALLPLHALNRTSLVLDSNPSSAYHAASTSARAAQVQVSPQPNPPSRPVAWLHDLDWAAVMKSIFADPLF